MNSFKLTLLCITMFASTLQSLSAAGNSDALKAFRAKTNLMTRQEEERATYDFILHLQSIGAKGDAAYLSRDFNWWFRDSTFAKLAKNQLSETRPIQSASGKYNSISEAETFQSTLDLLNDGTGSLNINTKFKVENASSDSELAKQYREALEVAFSKTLTIPSIKWTQSGSRITVSGQGGAGNTEIKTFSIQDNGDLIEEEGGERFIRSR